MPDRGDPMGRAVQTGDEARLAVEQLLDVLAGRGPATIDDVVADEALRQQVHAFQRAFGALAITVHVLVVSGGAASTRRISSIRRLCERVSGVAVVAVVESIDDGVARAMIAAGVRGVVLRAELGRTLAPTVRAARTGQISIPRPGRRQIFPPALSHRESAVLAKVALGQTNAEIAESLFLAESTVKSHLRSVFAKLGVNSRDEAAAAAGASLPTERPDPGLSDS